MTCCKSSLIVCACVVYVFCVCVLCMCCICVCCVYCVCCVCCVCCVLCVVCVVVLCVSVLYMLCCVCCAVRVVLYNYAEHTQFFHIFSHTLRISTFCLSRLLIISIIRLTYTCRLTLFGNLLRSSATCLLYASFVRISFAIAFISRRILLISSSFRRHSS